MLTANSDARMDGIISSLEIWEAFVKVFEFQHFVLLESLAVCFLYIWTIEICIPLSILYRKVSILRVWDIRT